MNLNSCGLYSYILSSICAASNEQADGCAFCRVMNGINAPKVVECYDSDGKTYRQLAKSGNDDLRQDAVRISVFFFSCFSVTHCLQLSNFSRPRAFSMVLKT